jgi:hypothetical protein
MSPETVDIVITDFLKEMTKRLDEAVRIAKAAEACAEVGNPKKGRRGSDGRRTPDVRGEHAALRGNPAQALLEIRAS